MHSWSYYIPKEHGSWVMLFTGLVLGYLVGGRLTTVGVLLGLMVVGLFLARKPLVYGLKRQDKKGLAIGAGLLILAGSIYAGLVLTLSLSWLLSFGAFGVVMWAVYLYLSKRKLSRSVAGELLGIAEVGLAAAGACLSSGKEFGFVALILGFLVFLYFGGSVFYVKLLAESNSTKPVKGGIVKAVSYQAACWAVIVLGAVFDIFPYLALLAFLPNTVKVIWGSFRVPQNVNFKRVGLTETWLSVWFLVIMAVIFGE